MGKRGPKPLPTQLVLRRGGRPNRPPELEPKPAAGAPPCPPWVQELAEARELWDELVVVLERCGILTQADGVVMGQLCVTYALWRRAVSFVAKYGMAFPIHGPKPAPDRKGPLLGFRSYPQARMVNGYSAQLLVLARELGLTPSARSRLTLDLPKDPANPAGGGGRDPFFSVG